MTVEHIEVLVEEPSMETALRILLPKILGQTSFEIYPHQCKNALLQKLPERLRGYAEWLPKSWRIVVVMDRDNENCHQLKDTLEKMAADAELPTRSNPRGTSYTVVNRLVIEELEAWYFGDWTAVRAAYPKASPHIPSSPKYRNPDAIPGGTWETFERILKKAGYFSNGLRKSEAARKIAPEMNPDHNTSHSFQVLRTALLEMTLL